MYTLYWDPGSANMAPHAALEEIGAAHQLVCVSLDKGEQRSDWYLKLNPHARVPTLAHDGLVMYESAAILMYLADRHPDSGLAPAVQAPERGLYLQWLAYLTNTVQEAILRYMHAEQYAADAAAQAGVKAEAERQLDRMWRFLDGVLAKGPYLLGERFSAADLFLVMLCRWTRRMAKPAMSYPNLGRCIDLVRARPAWQRMMQAEGITWTGAAT